MRYAEHVADLIGHTPLVRLNHVVPTGPDAPLVLAKVEYFNPGGSVKDRIAEKMIDAAEASGELKPGGTIVEPTSGNTGIGLAIIAQQRGYHCIFVVPDKVSVAKQDALRAYGAEVVVCPAAVEPESPESYYSVSDRLARDTDGGWKPNQYANLGQPRVARRVHRSRRSGTRPTGASRTSSPASAPAARSRAPATTSRTSPTGGCASSAPTPSARCTPAATGGPTSSRASARTSGRTTYDRGVPDEIVAVPDADSFHMTRRLAREEALLVGGSCGMAVCAAAKVAAEAGPDDVIVVLLPDGGRGYLSTVFNDGWMSSYGFLTPDTTEWTVGDVLRRKDGSIPDLVHGHPNETVADAVSIMREFGVSQMPIVKAEPPVMAAEVRGAVTVRDLLDKLFNDAGLAHRPRRGPPLESAAEPGQHRAAVEGGAGVARRRRGAGARRRPARRHRHPRRHPGVPRHGQPLRHGWTGVNPGCLGWTR